MRKTLLLVSKMTLRQELEIRELQSATLKTFLLKEPNPIIAAVKGGVSDFLEKSKQARASGGALPEGELHAYAWAAITDIAGQQALDETQKAVIASHRALMTSPDKIADMVYVAKMKKAFNKGEFKLIIAANPEHHELMNAVSQGICLTRAVEKKGQAPASGMSRELQSLVEKMSDATNK